jgi:hypothetical protein
MYDLDAQHGDTARRRVDEEDEERARPGRRGRRHHAAGGVPQPEPRDGQRPPPPGLHRVHVRSYLSGPRWPCGQRKPSAQVTAGAVGGAYGGSKPTSSPYAARPRCRSGCCCPGTRRSSRGSGLAASCRTAGGTRSASRRTGTVQAPICTSGREEWRRQHPAARIGPRRAIARARSARRGRCPVRRQREPTRLRNHPRKSRR